MRAFLGALGFALVLATAGGAGAAAPGDLVSLSALREGGHVLVMRHASTEPGVGDPPQFDVSNCSTQRNLSDAGRAEAAGFGRWLRSEGVGFERVLSSRWCRCLDTAGIAFGIAQPWPALDSFFGNRTTARIQTDEVRRAIAQWPGPGNLALVTHHVNIEALTGVVLAQGEALVLQPVAGSFRIVGRFSR